MKGSMSEAQDTMRRIAMGGDTGRRAFLRLWITSAIVSDFVTAKSLHDDVLTGIWREQDKRGDNSWPQEDRDLLLFIIQEIVNAMSGD
jgi:hypothetical protein